MRIGEEPAGEDRGGPNDHRQQRELARTRTDLACTRAVGDDELADVRATQGQGARDITAAAYEPKMNVTPNAVAVKD